MGVGVGVEVEVFEEDHVILPPSAPPVGVCVGRVPVKEFGVTPCGFWEKCGVENGGFGSNEYVLAEGDARFSSDEDVPAEAESPRKLETMSGFS